MTGEGFGIVQADADVEDDFPVCLFGEGRCGGVVRYSLTVVAPEGGELQAGACAAHALDFVRSYVTQVMGVEL